MESNLNLLRLQRENKKSIRACYSTGEDCTKKGTSMNRTDLQTLDVKWYFALPMGVSVKMAADMSMLI